MSRDARVLAYGSATVGGVFLGGAIIGALVFGIFPEAFIALDGATAPLAGAIALCAMMGLSVSIGALCAGAMAWSIVGLVGTEIVLAQERREADAAREFAAIEAELDAEIGTELGDRRA